MTKKEIVEAYNNLSTVVQSKLDEHKNITGYYFENVSQVGRMMIESSETKYVLEKRLEWRRHFISRIEQAIKTFQYFQSEEGKKMLGEYTKKKEDLENQLKEEESLLVTRFKDYLCSIGLDKWTTNDFPKEMSATVKHPDGSSIVVRVSKTAAGELALEPNSGLIFYDHMMSGVPTCQYQQYKACCIIVEHKAEADQFLDFWKSAIDKLDNISKEIEELEYKIKNPNKL